MEQYRLCIDSQNRYTYDCSGGNEKTFFYRYIYFEPLEYTNGGTTETISDAYRVTSKVIWYKRGYHEFDIRTILTDWRRI